MPATTSTVCKCEHKVRGSPPRLLVAALCCVLVAGVGCSGASGGGRTRPAWGHAGETKAHSEDGVAAAVQAAHAGDLERMRTLLPTLPSVNARGARGATVLMGAAAGGHKDIVVWLLQEYTADIDLEARCDLGNTALTWAARYGHARIVESLLHAGAEANAQDKEGWTALATVAHEGHAGVARALLALRPARRQIG